MSSTALVLGCVFALCLKVNADPVLELSSGATTTTIFDQVSPDANGTAGAITFVGAVGDFTLNVTTGITKPATGSASIPTLDLDSIDLSSTAGGILTIRFTETDFTNPVPPGFILDAGGITGGSVSFHAFYDATNTPFGEGGEIAGLGPFSSGVFSGTEHGSVSLSGPYSLTLVATIEHEAAGKSGFNAALNSGATANPEPGTLLLLGFCLVGLVALRRRQRVLTAR